MVINWDQINPNQGLALTKPREIYASLENKQWQRLRPEQNEVLEQWFERRTEPDLLIKQNTGGGKTLTGLLIAQSSLNEQVGPAVYLVPDTFLIKQVVDEAARASITVTENIHDEDFRASESILVTTFHKLLNGRSTFGVRHLKDVLPLGTIVIDDAHAALAASDSLFSSYVPADSETFDSLRKLFENELKHQSPKAFDEILAGAYSAPIRIPQASVAAKVDEMQAILRPYANDENNRKIFFAWSYIADLLKYAVVTFTYKGLEIKTPCPDISVIPAFHHAKRRIYLTATLADASVLVSELGASADSIATPITPKQASDLGDRIILAPKSINPRLADNAVHQLARQFADGYRDKDGRSLPPINVVVLVPSPRDALKWEGVADLTLTVKNMRPEIEEMKKGHHKGVVVLINKYDGVDLPDEACRLLIIDGIPTPLTPHEQREASALTHTETFKIRNIQKIEQGMGRGVRDVEDYCAVLVMTSDAALTLRDANSRKYYSPTTRAQINLSQQITEQVKGSEDGISVVAELLSIFLNRDSNWRSKSLASTADVTYDSEVTLSDISLARRAAFEHALSGDHVAALDSLRGQINKLEDPLEKGWYMEEQASYQYFVNPTDAQSTLRAARKLNPEVLKPDNALSYKRVSAPRKQAEAIAHRLANFYTPTDLELHVNQVLDNIIWGVEDTADTSEEHFKELGLFLGFGSSRPEKEVNDGGPDNLWALTSKRFVVAELKTEVSRQDERIMKSEAEQLGHSAGPWFENHHDSNEVAIPLLVHPFNVLHPEAHLPKGARVMTRKDFDNLRNNVTNFTRELCDLNAWGTEDVIQEKLSYYKLSGDRIIEAHSRIVRK